MKRVKTLYWIFTGLFVAAMLLSTIPNIFVSEDSVALITTQLHYPEYIIPFLGFAKLFGIIAILIPGFPRLTEWGYAGLFFDLIGASYSAIAVEGFHPAHLGMLIFIGLGALSYIYYHKKKSLSVAIA